MMYFLIFACIRDEKISHIKSGEKNRELSSRQRKEEKENFEGGKY